MDCTRVEELLALFSGDDLDVRQTEAVRAHLAGCPVCQAQAEGLAASRAWLQVVPPPQFDDAFYAELRQSVLRELPAMKEEAGRFAWLISLLPQWHWQPVMALATIALLLFVSWAVFRKGSGQPQPKPAPEVIAVNPTPAVTLEQKNAQVVHQPEIAAPRGLRNSITATSNRRKVVTPQPLVPTKTRLEEPKAAFLAQANTPDVRTASTAPTPEPEMMRIEFQTADPNIRIIWLTPKAPATNTTEPQSK